MASNEQITFGVGFQVDASGLNAVESAFDSLRNNINAEQYRRLNPGISNAQAQQKVIDIVSTSKQVSAALEKAFNPSINMHNIDAFKASLKESGTSIEKLYSDLSKFGPQGQQTFRAISGQILKMNQYTTQSSTLITNLQKTIKRIGSNILVTRGINSLLSTITGSYDFIKQLDTSLNNIRVVTGASADQMQRFAEQANKAAKQLGTKTTDYTNAALIYYQQGLGDKEVAARTQTTLKVMNITGQSAAAVSEQLTSLWNGYKVTTEQTEAFADKLAAVSTQSASSLQELATGISKVASSANMLGVSADELTAMMGTIIATTRQAPETVGTALKTIFARIADIKAGVEESGATLGTYSGKMAQMGVSVLDSTGSLRDMGDVIGQIGQKWQTMSREQQIALAQVMGGQRQYNNIVALFDNFNQYKDLLNVSENSSGTLAKQQEIHMDQLQAKITKMRAATQGMYIDMMKASDFSPIIDTITEITQAFGDWGKAMGGLTGIAEKLGPMLIGLFGDQISHRIGIMASNFIKVVSNFRQMSEIRSHLQEYGNFIKRDDVDPITKQQYILTKRLDTFSNVVPIGSERRKQVQQQIDSYIKQQSAYNIQAQAMASKQNIINNIAPTLGKQGNFNLFDTSLDADKVRTQLSELGAELNKLYQKKDQVHNLFTDMGKSAEQFGQDLKDSQKFIEDFNKATTKFGSSARIGKDYKQGNRSNDQVKTRLQSVLTKNGFGLSSPQGLQINAQSTPQQVQQQITQVRELQTAYENLKGMDLQTVFTVPGNMEAFRHQLQTIQQRANALGVQLPQQIQAMMAAMPKIEAGQLFNLEGLQQKINSIKAEWETMSKTLSASSPQAAGAVQKIAQALQEYEATINRVKQQQGNSGGPLNAEQIKSIQNAYQKLIEVVGPQLNQAFADQPGIIEFIANIGQLQGQLQATKSKVQEMAAGLSNVLKQLNVESIAKNLTDMIGMAGSISMAVSSISNAISAANDKNLTQAQRANRVMMSLSMGIGSIINAASKFSDIASSGFKSFTTNLQNVRGGVQAVAAGTAQATSSMASGWAMVGGAINAALGVIGIVASAIVLIWSISSALQQQEMKKMKQAADSAKDAAQDTISNINKQKQKLKENKKTLQDWVKAYDKYNLTTKEGFEDLITATETLTEKYGDQGFALDALNERYDLIAEKIRRLIQQQDQAQARLSGQAYTNQQQVFYNTFSKEAKDGKGQYLIRDTETGTYSLEFGAKNKQDGWLASGLKAKVGGDRDTRLYTDYAKNFDYIQYAQRNGIGIVTYDAKTAQENQWAVPVINGNILSFEQAAPKPGWFGSSTQGYYYSTPFFAMGKDGQHASNGSGLNISLQQKFDLTNYPGLYTQGENGEKIFTPNSADLLNLLIDTKTIGRDKINEYLAHQLQDYAVNDTEFKFNENSGILQDYRDYFDIKNLQMSQFRLLNLTPDKLMKIFNPEGKLAGLTGAMAAIRTGGSDSWNLSDEWENESEKIIKEFLMKIEGYSLEQVENLTFAQVQDIIDKNVLVNFYKDSNGQIDKLIESYQTYILDVLKISDKIWGSINFDQIFEEDGKTLKANAIATITKAKQQFEEQLKNSGFNIVDPNEVLYMNPGKYFYDMLYSKGGFYKQADQMNIRAAVESSEVVDLEKRDEYLTDLGSQTTAAGRRGMMRLAPYYNVFGSGFTGLIKENVQDLFGKAASISANTQGWVQVLKLAEVYKEGKTPDSAYKSQADKENLRAAQALTLSLKQIDLLMKNYGFEAKDIKEGDSIATLLKSNRFTNRLSNEQRNSLLRDIVYIAPETSLTSDQIEILNDAHQTELQLDADRAKQQLFESWLKIFTDSQYETMRFGFAQDLSQRAIPGRDNYDPLIEEFLKWASQQNVYGFDRSIKRSTVQSNIQKNLPLQQYNPIFYAIQRQLSTQSMFDSWVTGTGEGASAYSHYLRAQQALENGQGIPLLDDYANADALIQSGALDSVKTITQVLDYMRLGIFGLQDLGNVIKQVDANMQGVNLEKFKQKALQFGKTIGAVGQKVEKLEDLSDHKAAQLLYRTAQAQDYASGSKKGYKELIEQYANGDFTLDEVLNIAKQTYENDSRIKNYNPNTATVEETNEYNQIISQFKLLIKLLLGEQADQRTLNNYLRQFFNSKELVTVDQDGKIRNLTSSTAEEYNSRVDALTPEVRASIGQAFDLSGLSIEEYLKKRRSTLGITAEQKSILDNQYAAQYINNQDTLSPQQKQALQFYIKNNSQGKTLEQLDINDILIIQDLMKYNSMEALTAGYENGDFIGREADFTTQMTLLSKAAQTLRFTFNDVNGIFNGVGDANKQRIQSNTSLALQLLNDKTYAELLEMQVANPNYFGTNDDNLQQQYWKALLDRRGSKEIEVANNTPGITVINGIDWQSKFSGEEDNIPLLQAKALAITETYKDLNSLNTAIQNGEFKAKFGNIENTLLELLLEFYEKQFIYSTGNNNKFLQGVQEALYNALIPADLENQGDLTAAHAIAQARVKDISGLANLDQLSTYLSNNGITFTPDKSNDAKNLAKFVIQNQMANIISATDLAAAYNQVDKDKTYNIGTQTVNYEDIQSWYVQTLTENRELFINSLSQAQLNAIESVLQPGQKISDIDNATLLQYFAAIAYDTITQYRNAVRNGLITGSDKQEEFITQRTIATMGPTAKNNYQTVKNIVAGLNLEDADILALAQGGIVGGQGSVKTAMDILSDQDFDWIADNKKKEIYNALFVYETKVLDGIMSTALATIKAATTGGDWESQAAMFEAVLAANGDLSSLDVTNLTDKTQSAAVIGIVSKQQLQGMAKTKEQLVQLNDAYTTLTKGIQEQDAAIQALMATNAMQLIQQMQNVKSIEELNMLRDIGTFNDQNGKFDENKYNAGYIIAAQHEAEGMGYDNKVWNDMQQQIKDSNQAIANNGKLVAEATLKALKHQKAIKTLNNNYKAWTKTIKETGKNADGTWKAFSGDALAAINNYKKQLKDLLEVERDFDTDWIVANLDTINKAAQGNKKAIEQLRDSFAEFNAQNYSQEMKDALQPFIDADLSNKNFGDIAFSDNLLSSLATTLGAMTSMTDAAVADMNASFGDLGVEPVVYRLQIPNETWQSMVSSGTDEYFDKTTQKKYKVSLSGGTQSKTSGMWEVLGVNAQPRVVTTSGPKISNKGGGGGGGSKKKELHDEADPYYRVNKSAEKLSHEFERLTKAQEKLSGADLMENLQKQLELLEQQRDVQLQKLDIAKQQIQLHKQELQNFGVTFDDDGIITNRTEITAQWIDDLEHNRITDDEWTKRQNAIKNYDADVKTYYDTETAIDDFNDQIIKKRIELFYKPIELELDLRKAQQQWNEFLAKINKPIIGDQNFARRGNIALNIADIYTTDTTVGGKSTIQNLRKSVQDTQTEYEKALNNDKSSKFYGNPQLGRQKLQEQLQKLQQALTTVRDQALAAEQALLDGFNAVADKFDKRLNDYKNWSKQIQHDMQLTRTIFGDSAYDAFEKYYDQLAKSDSDQLNTAMSKKDAFKEQMERMEAAGDTSSAAYQRVKELYLQAVEEVNQAVDNSVQHAIDRYKNAIEKTFNTMEKTITNGKSFDRIKEQFELMNKYNDMYLDKVNAAYSIEKARAKFTDALNKNTGEAAQARINKLMKQQLGMLEDKQKLTKYDVERAEKLLDIEMKRIALEDAQNNKSEMRLARDANGNYSYEYVANDDNVFQAQQDLMQAENDLYNFDKDAYQQNIQNIYNTQVQWMQKLKAIYSDTTKTREEQDQEAAQVNKYYQDIMTGYLEMNTDIQNHLFEDVREHARQVFTESGEDAESILSFMQNPYQDLANSLSANGDIHTALTTAMGQLMASLSEEAEKLQQALNGISAAAGLNGEDGGAFGKLTDAASKLNEELEKIADSNGPLSKLHEAIDPILNDLQTLYDRFLALAGLIDGDDTSFAAALRAATAAQIALTTAMAQNANGAKTGGDNPAPTPTPTPGTGDPNGGGSSTQTGGGGGGSDSNDSSEDNETATSYIYFKCGNDEIKDPISKELKPGSVWIKRAPDIEGYIADDKSVTVGYNQSAIIRYHKAKYRFKLQKPLQPDQVFDDFLTKRQAEKERNRQARLNPYCAVTQIEEYKSGGYTGTWDGSSSIPQTDNGKLAILHQKELVLNAQDTQNMLNAIQIVRQINTDAQSIMMQLAGAIIEPMAKLEKESKFEIDQNVHITATFPGVNSSAEIEAALNNLVGLAAQHALSKEYDTQITPSGI